MKTITEGGLEEKTESGLTRVRISEAAFVESIRELMEDLDEQRLGLYKKFVKAVRPQEGFRTLYYSLNDADGDTVELWYEHVPKVLGFTMTTEEKPHG